MTDDDLLAHLKDILNCCGVSRAQTTIGGMDRFRLAINMAVAEERERCARIADGVAKKAFYGIDESHTDPWAAGRSAGADEIAEAIRGVTSPAGG